MWRHLVRELALCTNYGNDEHTFADPSDPIGDGQLNVVQLFDVQPTLSASTPVDFSDCADIIESDEPLGIIEQEYDCLNIFTC